MVHVVGVVANFLVKWIVAFGLLCVCVFAANCVVYLLLRLVVCG